MEHKKKILIVHNYYQIPGGEDTVVENEMKMLLKNGHDVTLYIRNNNELKTMDGLHKMTLPFTTVFNLKTYKDVRKIIKDKQIEIVHVHNTLNFISPAVYYAALHCHIPVVQTIHNFRILCPGATFYRDGHICEDCVTNGLGCAIKHNCYRNSKFQTLACVINTKIHRWTGIYGKINYICLTEFNKEKLLTLKQIKSNRVFVKPNYIDKTTDYLPENERENQYVYAGRLDKLKGIDLLLEAWKRMGKSAPMLFICGTGPMEDWCKKYAREYSCNVNFMGFVENNEAIKIMAKSKALILPTQWYEGFPMSILEAFSVGTPVLCSNLGNCGSLVEEGVSGLKFSYDNVDELIECVQKCSGLCESTYNLYKRNYSAEENYNLLEDIYSKVK